MQKYFYISLGMMSLVLGLAGILLPVLPTTPFLLLSAALFIRSSDRLYQWLTENPVLGSRIRRFREQGGMLLKEKIYAILLMWLMIGISLFFTGFNIYIILLGIIGTLVMGFKIKTL